MLPLLIIAAFIIFTIIQKVTAKPVNMTAKHLDIVKGLVKQNKVFIASKSYCPYCKQSKQLLAGLGANAHAIELDREAEGGELQQALASMTGMKTVPQIFINQKFIGGNSELQSLGTSKIKSLLNEGSSNI